MEEENENNTRPLEGQLGESIQSNDKNDDKKVKPLNIDYGKSAIVIFMITACLCGVIGFYVGITYITNECNTQYQEFFNEHTCIPGRGTGSTMHYAFPTFDVNTTGDTNVK